MAAVEATAKALEGVTVSKTKELKGASTPLLQHEGPLLTRILYRPRREIPS
jgi:hypothetical protein